jgi:hypothetical protein
MIVDNMPKCKIHELKQAIKSVLLDMDKSIYDPDKIKPLLNQYLQIISEMEKAKNLASSIHDKLCHRTVITEDTPLDERMARFALTRILEKNFLPGTIAEILAYMFSARTVLAPRTPYGLKEVKIAKRLLKEIPKTEDIDALFNFLNRFYGINQPESPIHSTELTRGDIIDI